MNFDAITIMALVDELNATLAGGRVQDSVQIETYSFGLEVYANHERHYLLLDAQQQYPRVHLAGEKLRRGVPQPTPLGLLIRRYVEGARIEGVRQPAWERIVIIDIDGPEGVFELVIEPMERRANILLVRDDGRIVDCAHRVGPQDNRVRTSLPNQPYNSPPPQKLKRDPHSITPDKLGEWLDGYPGERARQVLTRQVLGVSPLVAKEIVFRATGAVNTKAADTAAGILFEALSEVFGRVHTRAWEPGIAGAEGLPAAYAAYPLTHLDGWTPVESMSAALASYYGPLLGADAYKAAKQPVQVEITEATIRVSKKLEALRDQVRDEAALEHLKQSGELLLAYQYSLEPGQDVLRAQYEVDGPELEIKLDTTMTPLENAQHYFEKYDKAKRALANVPKLIAVTEQELEYLAQLETDLVLATNWPEIGEVQEQLQANGYWRGTATRQPGSGRSGPLKVTDSSGFVFWVGRNARQNDTVTFDRGGPADLWLHVRGVPGAHVIIKSGAQQVPDDVIQRAAAIAAYYSKLRTEARVLVDVTLRKHVRKIKGGKPGMVTYRNESPVEVVPASEKDV